MSVSNESGNVKGYVDNNLAKEEESGIDVRLLWVLFLKYKYWFLGSVFFCVCVAFVYLRYSTPVYNITAKVLIKDQEKRPYSNSINSTFSELGLMNSSDGFDNEVEVLATKTLNKKAVNALKLYTQYFIDGTVKDREIYGKYAPFTVDMDREMLDSLMYMVELNISQKDNHYVAEIKYDEAEMSKILTEFPTRIETSFGNIYISRNPNYDIMLDRTKRLAEINGEEFDIEEVDIMNKKTLKVYICPLEYTAMAYASRLSVEPTSKTTTIAQLSLNDNIPERGRDYLDTLVAMYNRDAEIDNNLEATRTSEFIQKRLNLIERELGMTETEMEGRKISAGIVDFENDVKVDVTQSVQYESQLVEVETQQKLVESLLDYVLDSKNYLSIIPSNVGLKDNSLSEMVGKYNETVLERNRLLRVASENNPSVQLQTEKAAGYFDGIRASLQSSKNQLAIQHKDLMNQKRKYESRISSAPTNERIFGDIERQQTVQVELYLMLLQKREENEIVLASSAYKAKLIEEPTSSNTPVSPKKKMILMVAFVLGLVIPFAFYYIRNFFRYRIESMDDVMKLTTVPILGSVPLVKALIKGNRTVVVQENRNSLMTEVYRVIRSNLPFVLKKDEKVILFTSSTSGEGKTSIASNLGASIAFVGKKVLIMGLDIRKPRLAGLFNLADTEKGITNFLTRDKSDYKYLENLIQPSGINENLHILPAGPIPPNPAELLETDNLLSAIEYLKTKYDYILLDTAPIGLVSDTLSIGKCADLTLYVVRANYTLKADMELVNSLSTEKRLPNINIVMNAVSSTPSDHSYRRYGNYGYRGYGYSYGYGYGYGYGEDKGKKLEEV